MKKAAFIDRDGTIILDEGYVSEPSKVILLPNVAKALKILSDSGYILVIVTNQSGIGRGYFSETNSIAVSKKMEELLSAESVRIDGIYFCPHAPEANCECRKPAPGLLLKAAKELNIDLSQSVMIGDKESDPEAGLAAGCKFNLRINSSAVACDSKFPVFNSILDAVNYIQNRG